MSRHKKHKEIMIKRRESRSAYGKDNGIRYEGRNTDLKCEAVMKPEEEKTPETDFADLKSLEKYRIKIKTNQYGLSLYRKFNKNGKKDKNSPGK